MYKIDKRLIKNYQTNQQIIISLISALNYKYLIDTFVCMCVYES